MNGFRRRVLLPLVIPLGATALFVAVVFNLSRILLILEERRSATTATVLAIVAAVAILGGFTWFANRAEARRVGLSMLGSVGVVLVFAGGYSFGAADEGGEHGEKETPKGGVVDIAGKEFAFEPKDASVPAGPVTINLANTGKVIHTLMFEDVPAFTKISAPKAGTATGTTDLKPGTYVYFCDEAGHRKAGMEGTLTVTKGGAGEKVAGAAAGKSGGATKDVVGKEFLFEPKALSVPAGPVTFNLKNDGKVVHTLAIENVPAFTKLSAPKGGTATGKADLAPGKYVFFCDEAGHRKAGMEGTLQVG